MTTKLSDLLVSEWPPSRWHRQARRGSIAWEGRSWKDPSGEARLQDVVDNSDNSLMLVVSDNNGREWANIIELPDERAAREVSRSLSGALGRRVSDVASIQIPTLPADIQPKKSQRNGG